MPSRDLDPLLADYLDGDLDEAGRVRLAQLLECDEAAARRFGEALKLEALLLAAHGEPPPAARLAAGVARRRSRRRWPAALVAAAALLAAAAALALLSGARRRAPNQVLSGRVLAGGMPARRVPDGARIEVAGAEPAVIRLADGSRAEFSPASRAVLRGRVGGVRQVVELSAGGGGFKVEKNREQFRVETPVGTVTVLGTEFSVELRRSKGGGKMSRKVALALAVAVTVGSVRVDFGGKGHVLSAGQSRVFAAEEGEEKPALPKSLYGFSGQVRGVVVKKGEKNTFTFKVGRVLKVWKGSKAEKPKALAGRTLRVGPRWVKNKRGKWHPVELHVAFIRKLKAGAELTLEIRHAEREAFAILELSKEQRESAKGKKSGDATDF